MRMLWLTDTHLNFLPSFVLDDFIYYLQDQKAEGIILTGDISNGTDIISHLRKIHHRLQIPIYFVLGNHDFYGSTFQSIRQQILELKVECPKLHYMTLEQVIKIGDVALIGDDGWYDARFRKPLTNLAFLPDWWRIKDFFNLFSPIEKMRLMRDLALQSAQAATKKLKQAFQDANRVYFLTHIPPWPSKESPILDKFWAPYNSSKIMAQSLTELMEEYPNKELIILSGHTHVRRDEQILPNLRLKVGEARIFFPKVQEILDI